MGAKDIAIIMRRIMGLFLIVSLLTLNSIGGQRLARADAFEEYRVLVGDLLTIPTHALSRMSLTAPEVADISDANPDSITLMGKTEGQTILFIWEAGGKRTVVIRVSALDLAMIEARLQSLFESAKLTAIQMTENQAEGKIVLTGDVPDDKAETFSKITDQFSSQLIDLTKAEDIKDLIQIDMQITELKTTLYKAMGVKWSSNGDGNMQWAIQETPPTPLTGKLGDLFKIGHFNRSSTAIAATVDFLVANGKARVLSKPRIVVRSGKQATFLVGGEIPISTSTTAAGTTNAISTNVEFKEYGVSLSVTPTIKEGKVEIKLNTEISQPDTTPIAGSSGSTSFTTQSATTEVVLDDKQTIVLAGLIKKDRDRNETQVPFLGKIPVVGWLFKARYSKAPDTDDEVVISLTPTIVHSSKPPAEEAQSATIETRVPRAVEPPTEEFIPPLTSITTRDTIGVPTITKNVGTSSVNVPEAIAPYVQAVQEKISASIAFPYEAQQNGWQGTVKLALVVKRDGSLRDVFVKESSGYDVFDQDAVNTAQILAPYAPFADNIKEEELSLTIPIVYSQDSFLKNVAKHN